MSVDRVAVPRGVALPALTRWGVSPDADLAYRTLATFGPRDARQLARELGISIRRAQAAVDELVTVPAVVTADRGWRALPSAEVVAAVRRKPRVVVDMGDYVRRHQSILSTVGLPEGMRANLLPDRATTRLRIAELMTAERREHLALHPERSFAPDAAAAALPLDRQLLARGVRLRTCGVPPDDGDASCAAAQELAGMGAEYRERAEVPLKLMVFDRRIAMLPVDPLDLAAGTLEIDNPAVVGALIILFEQLWSTGVDPRRHGVPPIVLTPREEAVLGLLAGGHTDDSAAKQLGISRRTIAYSLRALMDRLGVDNRFQLGLVLGAAKAVAPPRED